MNSVSVVKHLGSWSVYIQFNYAYGAEITAKICDIFHNLFYCVKVLYNQQTSIFRNIKESFGYETQNNKFRDSK